MTPQEWASMSARIAAWWPATKWTAEMFAVWFEDLQQFEAADVRGALDELKMQPGAFAPSIGDLLSRLRTDVSVPTFDEMFALLFGPRGALAAKGVDGTRAKLVGMHPLVGSFALRQGIQRLKELPVHDEENGHWRVRELRDAWGEHVAAMDARQMVALTSARGNGELARLDPLASLGLGEDSQRALPSAG